VLVGLVVGLGCVLAPAGAARAEPEADRPVVVVGTAGVRWSDVSAEVTPTLRLLGDTWSAGNAAVRSVRQVTCPADGWLAVSAGARAADFVHDDGCRELEAPVDQLVPGWDDYVEASHRSRYHAVPGSLGEALTAAQITALGIGPGAAVALAGADGTLAGPWTDRPDDPEQLTTLVADALEAGTTLVVVDLGAVREGHRSLPDVDQGLAAVLAGAGTADVVVVSLADRGDQSQMQLVVAGSPGVDEPGLLTSASTRQAGLVLGIDVTATVLDRLGVDQPSAMLGTPFRTVPSGSASDSLVDDAHQAAVARPLVPQFYLGLVVVNLVFFAVVWFGLARSPTYRVDQRRRRLVLRWLTVTGLMTAALPVALLVANVVPWWRTGVPPLTLVGCALVVAAAVVAVALVGPWRRCALGPAALVAGLSAAVIVVDVLTGSRVQLSAVFGSSALVAGRFYGFNNRMFALATAGTLLLVSALVVPLVRTGRRRSAAAVAAVAGVGLTIVDGTPGLGTDFGGPPALVPAFTVFVLLLAGARITWRRTGAVLAGAVGVTVAFAVLDWLRPADRRTHLGSFVQAVVDGEWPQVVARNASANLHALNNSLWLTLLAIAGFALGAALLVKPVKRLLASPDGGRYAWLSDGAPLASLADEVPTLVPFLVAGSTAMLIGFAMNDSGIAIPASGLGLVVPLLVATYAHWMATAQHPEPAMTRSDTAERG